MTALYVAFARAVSTHDPQLSRACNDPYAELLLPTALGRVVQRAAHSPHAARRLTFLRNSMLGLGEHLALRTRLIDDAVDAAVANGARNLVIVGAGLDARAHRLTSLAACDVFEVDFPSTQQFKRERARDLPVCAKTLHYVPCDFERTDLDQALLGAGFDARTPSIWIWEGVTMYLTQALVAHSLDLMARLSADKSRLIASYLTPFPPTRKVLTALGLSVLGAVSEPVRSWFEIEAMSSMLRERSFEPLSDLHSRAVAARYGIRFPPFAYGAPPERVVVAEKRARA